MTGSDADKLIDQLIGEAVLALLQERGPLTSASLVQRLREMKARDKDPRRREILARAIAETADSISALQRHKTAQGRSTREGTLLNRKGNALSSAGSGKPADPKKMH